MALPGGGMLVGGIAKQGEKAAANTAVKAAAKKAGKEAAEEAAEHIDEAAAKRLLKQLEEKAAKDAEEKAAREAQEKAAREAGQRAEREAEERVAKEAGEMVPPADPKGGTYVLRDPKSNASMRSGRTKDLEVRETQHGRHPALGKYRYDVENRTDNLIEQRGLEQILHDTHHPPLNKIRPIDPKNPRYDEYMEAAKRFLEREKNH
jgi:uncharacterized protein with von Willebrand factor type A (vWA) domain